MEKVMGGDKSGIQRRDSWVVKRGGYWQLAHTDPEQEDHKSAYTEKAGEGSDREIGSGYGTYA